MLIDAEKMSGSNHRKLLMAQPRWNRGLKRLGIALLLFIFCTVWIFIKHDFYHLKKFFLSPRIYVMVFNYPTTFRCFTLILWQYHRYADEPLKLDLNLIGFKTLNSFRFRNSWLALFIMEWLERSILWNLFPADAVLILQRVMKSGYRHNCCEVYTEVVSFLPLDEIKRRQLFKAITKHYKTDQNSDNLWTTVFSHVCLWDTVHCYCPSRNHVEKRKSRRL